MERNVRREANLSELFTIPSGAHQAQVRVRRSVVGWPAEAERIGGWIERLAYPARSRFASSTKQNLEEGPDTGNTRKN
jgi:hypothetical protein